MILAVDASAGVSGDMLLAGFLDLGLPLPRLQRILSDLGVSGVEVGLHRIARGRDQALQVFFRKGTSASDIPNRGFELLQWVNQSRCDASIKRDALRVLNNLLRAEGAAHGVSWKRVILHQLADLDTVVNIVGFCAGLAFFRVQAVYVSPIPVGPWHQDPHGQWKASPGPATQWLLRDLIMDQRETRFEWTTPPGAALLSTFGSHRPAPPFRLHKIGHGVGHRIYNGTRYKLVPGTVQQKALRLLLGQPLSSCKRGKAMRHPLLATVLERYQGTRYKLVPGTALTYFDGRDFPFRGFIREEEKVTLDMTLGIH